HGPGTISDALVAIPSRSAWYTPTLAACEDPRSSAVTISSDVPAGWPSRSTRPLPLPRPGPATRRPYRRATAPGYGARVPYGITVPFDGVPLGEQRSWWEECAELGYTDLWSVETNGADAFVPLALAAVWTPRLRLGTAIVPVFTRGPALLAQSAATLATLAPGRFALGVGSSTEPIVTRWNGIAFEEPYLRTRDVVRFLKAALAGERVDEAYDTFTVRGFRLALVPEVVPPILVAALRPGMLHMAAREADGVIINWLSASDVKTVVAEVGPGKEVVCRIFVCPSDDAETVRKAARFTMASYLTVPVYSAFHDWLGRGTLLAGLRERWAAG